MKNKVIISISENLLNIKEDNYEVSTGLIIQQEGKYVFTIQNPDRWTINNDNEKEAGLVAVGGKLEKDETVIECAKRECFEELNSRIELNDSKTTYLATSTKIEKVVIDPIQHEVRPYFIILLERTEKGRKPYTLVFSYKGVIFDKPKPVDVSALVVAESSIFASLSSGPKNIKFLKNISAEVIERFTIPEDLLLKPYGTLSVYIRLLEFEKDKLQ